MKRSATHLFKRQSKNRTFSKLSNFYFDLRPPGADPRARQRSENPTQGQLECANPRGRQGGVVRREYLGSEISRSQISLFSLLFLYVPKNLFQSENFCRTADSLGHLGCLTKLV